MKTSNNSFNILCVYKPDHNEANAITSLAIDFFATFGINCFLMSSHTKKEEIERQALISKAVLVFGGDGTMLATARALHSLAIPLFGFNMGRIGFLMEANPNQSELWLRRFLVSLKILYPNDLEFIDNSISKEEALFIEEHNILQCDVINKGNVKYRSYAINDAVVSRRNIARAISLSISVDQNHLSTLRCDGLIVSSPLGATGYALSAHGPLALPGLQATIITPICPFASSLPPCVVSSSSTITICTPEINDQTILTLDGQENIELAHDDIVSISAHIHKMKLLISDKAWYSKRLVERGFIRHML